jgi:hypothetical protein
LGIGIHSAEHLARFKPAIFRGNRRPSIIRGLLR